MTFELEKDVIEEQLDLWLQVSNGGWLDNGVISVLYKGTFMGEKLV